MSRSRLALVAPDPRLAGVVQSSLGGAVPEPVQLRTFESIADAIGPETDGLLVVACSSPEDCERARRLVQELRLQQLPPIVLLVATAEAYDELEPLAPYVAQRVRWPVEAAQLAGFVRKRLGRCRPFAGPDDDELPERIRHRLLAQTPSLATLAEPLALAAVHDVTILLTGETGSGKTYLARLIHDHSPRRDSRFLVVPCGALSASLLESEFFGHAKGAFTGADQPKVGKFGAAVDGTLLLDEIDALNLEHQVALLRVIETGEYEPVGSNETKVSTARVIVATNWDLAGAVEQGKFRRDLFYRLNVMSFYLPPLRERVQDVAPLARGIAARFNAKFNKGLFDVAPEAVRALEAFPWPGNIRQLENVVQQAVLVSTGPELQLKHLPPLVQEHARTAPAEACQAPAGSLAQTRETHERAVIERVLEQAGYSRTRAATMLGVSRVTLYKKMKKYGLMELPGRSADGRDEEFVAEARGI
jgi:two-component system response regulator HydG